MVEPTATPVSTPVVGTTVAIEGVVVAQVADFVTSDVVASEYVPLAANCVLTPIAVYAGFGVIAIDWSTAGVTVRVALPKTDPELAVIIAIPSPAACASPVAAFTVATEVWLEVQVAIPLRSAVLPSLKFPIALNCCVTPLGALIASGVTVIESKLLTNETRATRVAPLRM